MQHESDSRKELEERVHALEQEKRVRDEFIATVCHDLRTPLNAIGGWAALLNAGKAGPDEMRRIAEAIDRNVRIQAKLIGDLLDLSRLMSGTLALEMHEVHLPRTVESVARTFLAAIEQKNLKLEQHIDGDAPPIRADVARVEQVITSLIDNAVKFTPDGGRIGVRVRREGPWVECAVTDSGEGIEPHLLPGLFSRFDSERAPGTPKPLGKGLGLAIARHLVDLHGGRINVTSEGFGKGTAVSVAFPIPPAGAEPALATRQAG